MALSSRHFRKASLCKQTAYYNRTCSQAKTQSAVTAWCLRSGLHCFLLLSHQTVAPYRDKPRPSVGHKAPSAHDKSLNQYLSLEKGAKSLFFFFLLEDLTPSLKVLSCSYHSANQRVLDVFLCPTTFRDLGQVGLQLQQRPQKKRQISKLSRLTPTMWAVALSDNNKIILKKKQQIKLICFLDLQVFFSISHCNSGRCAT